MPKTTHLGLSMNWRRELDIVPQRTWMTESEQVRLRRHSGLLWLCVVGHLRQNNSAKRVRRSRLVELLGSGSIEKYVSRLLRLSSLAPDIITAIVNGKNPPQLTAKKLMRLALEIPVDWTAQRKLLGFHAR